MQIDDICVERDKHHDILSITVSQPMRDPVTLDALIRGPTGMNGFRGAPGERGAPGHDTPGVTGPTGECGEYPIRAFLDANDALVILTNTGKRLESAKMESYLTGPRGAEGARLDKLHFNNSNLVVALTNGKELFLDIPALQVQVIDRSELPPTAYVVHT
jgi:hypothetical protein